MKILLPPKKLCKKMYKLINRFYNSQKNIKHGISITERQSFSEVIKIFCDYYDIDYPKVNFKKIVDKYNALGECTEKGIINLLCPNAFYKRKYKGGLTCTYVGLVYHELGHYYLWSNPEIKALEFELKMIKRR